MDQTGKLTRGFCKSIYRKAQNINRQICQLLSKQLITRAQSQGATVIAFENLTCWRPKGGKKGSTLRRRFHRWLKSRLIQLTTGKFTELSGKVEFVFPRGTSSYAYDGSDKLRRGSKNYALAKFKTGKRYNCDLSASYNIAAKFWLNKLKPTWRNRRGSVSSKSSRTKPRMPDLLCSLWSQMPRLDSARELIAGCIHQTDVTLVIGANDIVNPAARHDTASTIYGMPILEVDKVKQTIVIKRGMSTGFAGVNYELFYKDKTTMLFCSAKDIVSKLVAEVKQL